MRETKAQTRLGGLKPSRVWHRRRDIHASLGSVPGCPDEA